MSGIRRVCVLFTLVLLTACAGSAAAPAGGIEADAAGAPVVAAEPEAPTPDAPTPDAPTPASPIDTEPATTGSTEANQVDTATDQTTTDETTTADSSTTNEDVASMAPTPTDTPEPTPTPAAAEPPTADCIRLTEFALDAENFGWFIVNDNVMGGRSSGGPIFENSAMVFEGAINTDGGGFSSVRAEIAPTTLAGYTHLIVRARTDDRTYKVTLEDGLETRDRRISQQQELVFGEPDTDGWQTARIDFDQLDPRIFGRGVESDPFRPDLATQLGIMISDGVDGPFRIEIDWIDACR